MAPPNLYDELPLTREAEERFETLLEKPGVRIERIISSGQASPPGFWFEQEQTEWVVLLQGSAGLRFDDEDEVRELKPGDWLLIAAHRRHRVEWTDLQQPTVWLAVHFDD